MLFNILIDKYIPIINMAIANTIPNTFPHVKGLLIVQVIPKNMINMLKIITITYLINLWIFGLFIKSAIKGSIYSTHFQANNNTIFLNRQFP